MNFCSILILDFTTANTFLWQPGKLFFLSALAGNGGNRLPLPA